MKNEKLCVCVKCVGAACTHQYEPIVPPLCPTEFSNLSTLSVPKAATRVPATRTVQSHACISQRAKADT